MGQRDPSLSPPSIILEEAKRLWAVGDIFISTKVSDLQAKLRTVDVQDKLIYSLTLKDHAQCLSVIEAHSESTASGVSPSDWRKRLALT